MAGGIFDRPFTINIKCVIFSLICISLFLYKPEFQNLYVLYGVLFIIATISYVSMAWYDYYFNCDILPLKKGKYSWQQYIKPPAHEPKKQVDNSETSNISIDERRRLYLIYASHILFIVPLLAYLALYRKSVNPIVYPILGVLAAFTLLYHGFSFIAYTKI
jgi:hypothetical protein